MAPFQGMARKTLLRLGAGAVLLVVIHQLSFIDYSAFAGQVPVSTEVIKTCPRPGHEPPHGHDAGIDIPNIVHQIWKTANVSTYSTDESHTAWKALLEPMNYTSRLWTDDDILRLIETEYAWLLPTYRGYPRDIQRADLARLVVVHARGGIYVDLDVHPRSTETMACLQRLKLDAIFASTSDASPGLSNHFFMGARGSAFLLWALREAQRRGAYKSRRILLPYLQVFWSTGPMMLTSASRDFASSARGGTGGTGGSPRLGLLAGPLTKSVVAHAAGRSWHSFDGWLLNYLEDHSGHGPPWGTLLAVLAVVVLGYVVVRRRWAWAVAGPRTKMSF